MSENPFQSKRTRAGTRLQSGIPKGKQSWGARPRGMLMRGVVVNTYVSDDDGHPHAGDTANPPTTVYCDVIVFPSLAGQRWFGLKNVAVLQSRGGLHRGSIWKPRPSTLDITGDECDVAGGSNPAYLDGDHVLVGFLGNTVLQPLILGGLPHPALDAGGEKDDVLGKRQKLTKADGDPDLQKHHGVFWGVDNLGNWLVNSTFGNDGTLDGAGKEADPPTDGTKGNQIINLPQDSSLTINLMDMADPKNPVPKVTINVAKGGETVDIKNSTGKWHLKVEDGETVTIKGKDAAAKLTLGDGAVSVAVADHLQTLYEGLKGKLDAFDTHKHPTGVGPSGPPDVLVVADPWDLNINSDKAKIPNTG